MMHIYDKQCGIIQKINGRVQTFRFSVFTMGRQEIFAKEMEKQENYNVLTQNFQILSILKLWWLLGLAVFKGELLALKVMANSTKKLSKNFKKKSCAEKKYIYIFNFPPEKFERNF